MICKDCLIWQNHRKTLVFFNTDYYNEVVVYDKKMRAGGVVVRELEIPLFRKLWRNNELLADKKCSTICRLISPELSRDIKKARRV